MNNTDRHPECHMRTALGNCDPIGGFCTSVNEPICEALHKVSRSQGEWTNAGMLTVQCSNCKSQFHELEAMNFCPNCGAKMKEY